MFSRAERSFLQFLADEPAATAQRRLESEFPNPTYRRKLMWGIRRKADRSLADWQLYLAAAEREERLLPRSRAHGAGQHPVFADPLVPLMEDFRRFWARRRRTAADGKPEGPRGVR